MAIGNPVSLTSHVASKTISVIATAGQTAFTVTGGYRINQLAVFRNGVRLVDSRDYEARDGATVTLLSAASNGDSLEFQVFDSFQVSDTINPYSTYQTINGNLNITGIITAATFSVTDLDVRNITGVAATFTGQVTYEDVTNVDSIGLSTFRDGVHVGAGLSVGGNVLFGGTADAGYTSFADNLTLEDSANCGITIRSGSSNQGNIYFSDDTGTAPGTYAGIVGYAHATNHMFFFTNSSERVRIDSSGRIGIGTTGSAHSYIQTIFGHTTGNRAAGTVYQNATTGNDSSNGFLIGNSNGIDAYIWNYEVANIRFATSGTERLTLNPSGDVNITGVCTATSFFGDGSGLSGVSGYNDLDNALFG